MRLHLRPLFVGGGGHLSSRRKGEVVKQHSIVRHKSFYA
jgi:hypothetical protein